MQQPPGRPSGYPRPAAHTSHECTLHHYHIQPAMFMQGRCGLTLPPSADMDIAVSESMLQESEIKAVKACPTCRAPLGQVMRYGRPLNHAKVQLAETKFFLQCSAALLQADSDFSKVCRVAADWTAKAGTHHKWLACCRHGPM